MSSSTDPSYTPEYNEKHPNFPFTRLHPPPPEWELYDIPDKTHLRNRALDLGTFKKLVRHHTWGFDVVIGDRKTKDRLLQVLKRVVYNQEASLRPTWHEFVSRQCDSGPRLLRRSYEALRISRRFPDGVQGQPLRWGGEMPKDGLEVQGTSGDRSAGLGIGMNPSINAGLSAPIQIQQPYLEDGLYNSPGINGGMVSPFASTIATTPAPLMYDRQHHLGSPGPSQMPTPMSVCRATPPSLNTPLPSIQRPSGHKSIQRLRLAVSGEIPHFTPSPAGHLFPTYGRGPVSLTSDAVSCAIVAGLLLNLNSPSLTPNTQLSTVESAFLASLSIPWSSLADTQSSTRVDELRNLCKEYVAAVNKAANPLAAINGTKTHIPLTNANVWKICANSLSQVRISYREGARGCACQGQANGKNGTKTVSGPYITTDARDGCGRDMDLDSSIRQFFAYERGVKCAKCGGDNAMVVNRQFESVPLKLVVRPDTRVSFQRHGADVVEVEYVGLAEKMQRAKFRWVGGIYPVQSTQQQTQVSYRVFWTYRTPGGVDTGALRMYDAAQLSGTIVGGVHLARTGERVPARWWTRSAGAGPLLFYEKIEDTGVSAGAALWSQTAMVGNNSSNQTQRQAYTPLQEIQNQNFSAGHSPRSMARDTPHFNNMNMDLQLSPVACPWSSSPPQIEYKTDITNLSGGTAPDAYENMLSAPAQLEHAIRDDTSRPGTWSNDNNNNNCIGWVPHSEPQRCASTTAGSTNATANGFACDSAMFMDMDMNMDMNIDAADLGLDGSLDFDTTDHIRSTYPPLPDITSSTPLATATTTVGEMTAITTTAPNTNPRTTSSPATTSVDARICDNVQTGSGTSTGVNTSTCISTPNDINWAFTMANATDRQPGSTASGDRSTTATTTATAADLQAGIEYNAFDASLDAFSNSFLPDALDTSIPPMSMRDGETVALPPNSLTLSRKRSVAGTGTDTGAGHVAEKRVKM